MTENAPRASRCWRLTADACIGCEQDGPLARALDTVFGAMATEEARPTLRLALAPVEGRDDDGDRDEPAEAWQLLGNGVPLVSGAAVRELCPLLEGSLVGFAIRTRFDAVAFHAAAIDVDRQPVLLLGDKGSGKSTLAAYFARRGARYYGDEVAFVRASDRAILPFPKAATLKQGSFALFPDGPTFDDRVRGPVRYVAADNPGKPGTAAARPARLVFPRYAPDAAPRAEKLAGPDVAFALIPMLFGGLERHPQSVGLVAELARTTPAYLLEYSSLGEAEDLLERLPNG